MQQRTNPPCVPVPISKPEDTTLRYAFSACKVHPEESTGQSHGRAAFRRDPARQGQTGHGGGIREARQSRRTSGHADDGRLQGYYLVAGGDDTITAVSLFTNKAMAETSTQTLMPSIQGKPGAPARLSDGSDRRHRRRQRMSERCAPAYPRLADLTTPIEEPEVRAPTGSPFAHFTRW